MNKKIWFYLSIILIPTVIIQGAALLGFFANSAVNFNEVSMEEYIALPGDGITLDCGYIADAEIAAEVGGSIIDCVCKESGKTILPWEKGSFGVYVEYDSVLRLWRISKGYFSHRGAVVILEQDTGRVVNILFQK